MLRACCVKPLVALPASVIYEEAVIPTPAPIVINLVMLGGVPLTFTEVPEVPEDPEVPDVPDVPLVPDVPDDPLVPEDPDVPDVPDVPEVPDLPLGPNATFEIQSPAVCI